MKYYLLPFFLFFCGYLAVSQNNSVDKIIAVIGEEIILKSDIENEYMQGQGQGLISSSAADYRVEILERLLIQKLLLAQAKVDSISVTEDEVEADVEQQVQGLISNIGSVEKLQTYFGKNIEEIKSDMRAPFRERLITNQMQQKIVEKVRTTPSEVRAFYRKFPKDSLIDIPDKYEIQQIVVQPTVSEAEKERIRERLREFREQIQNGEKTFTTLAVQYSEDGSAVRGGELGYSTKSGWDPAFAEAAFSLKPGRISKIVESEFGFHILQLIDRKGEQVNVRHIILQPKVSDEERKEALARLDTVRQYLQEGKMTFEEAAFFFSSDKKTRNNGGLIASPNSLDSRLAKAEIQGDMAKQVNQLKVGEISEPFMDRSNGKEEYKIIKIKALYPQHKANLEDDWTEFETMLENEKRMALLEKWIQEKQVETYIRIDDAYKNSKFRYKNWVK